MNVRSFFLLAVARIAGSVLVRAITSVVNRQWLHLLQSLSVVGLAASCSPTLAALSQLFGRELEVFEVGFAKVRLAQPCAEAISYMPGLPDAERTSKATLMRTLFWRTGDVTFEIRCFGGHVLNTTRTSGAPSFFSTK